MRGSVDVIIRPGKLSRQKVFKCAAKVLQIFQWLNVSDECEQALCYLKLLKFFFGQSFIMKRVR